MRESQTRHAVRELHATSQHRAGQSCVRAGEQVHSVDIHRAVHCRVWPVVRSRIPSAAIHWTICQQAGAGHVQLAFFEYASLLPGTSPVWIWRRWSCTDDGHRSVTWCSWRCPRRRCHGAKQDGENHVKAAHRQRRISAEDNVPVLSDPANRLPDGRGRWRTSQRHTDTDRLLLSAPVLQHPSQRLLTTSSRQLWSVAGVPADYGNASVGRLYCLLSWLRLAVRPLLLPPDKWQPLIPGAQGDMYRGVSASTTLHSHPAAQSRVWFIEVR